MEDFKGLEENIGYTFKNTHLLKRALTHPSYLNERRENRIYSNQRLEFFGDSVLSLAVSEYIFLNLKSFPEGKLTDLRAKAVCEDTLAKMAKKLRIGEYLLLGNGEKKIGGANRPSTLCDAMEAVIAAVYLDGGMEAAKRLILSNLTETIDALSSGETLIGNYKTELQEIVQADGGELYYEVVGESGPEHQKSFEVAVFINGKEKVRAIGSSKKKAEQAAAQKTIELLKK